jgi:hypothetical protein
MRKKILIAAGITLVALSVFVAFLPTMAGTRWFVDPLVKRLAADRFILNIDSVKLRWLSPLQFRGISIKRDGDVPLITIESIQTNRSLLGYLIGGRRLGRVEIIRPTIDVELLEKGSNLTNLVNAIRTDDKKEPTVRSNPKIDLEVVIKEMSAKVQQHAAQAPLVVIPPFDVAFSYQAYESDAHITVPAAKILKQVELNHDLMKLGLEYALPVLAKSAWLDGNVSLDIGSADIYLDHPEKSNGQAVLTLHQVRSGPTNPAILQLLDTLARLRDREPVHELVFVDGSQIDLSLADQRVTHSGLRFGLPKIDPRLQIASAGSVDTKDRSLDLNVELPIPVERFARRDTVKSLGIPTINLPVKGTLDDPQPDWSVMRDESAVVFAAIQEQLSEEAPGTAAAIGAISGLVGGDADDAVRAAADLASELYQRRKAAKEEAAKNGNPQATETPVREALRGLLRGHKQSSQ